MHFQASIEEEPSVRRTLRDSKIIDPFKEPLKDPLKVPIGTGGLRFSLVLLRQGPDEEDKELALQLLVCLNRVWGLGLRVYLFAEKTYFFLFFIMVSIYIYIVP